MHLTPLKMPRHLTNSGEISTQSFGTLADHLVSTKSLGCCTLQPKRPIFKLRRRSGKCRDTNSRGAFTTPRCRTPPSRSKRNQINVKNGFFKRGKKSQRRRRRRFRRRRRRRRRRRFRRRHHRRRRRRLKQRVI